MTKSPCRPRWLVLVATVLTVVLLGCLQFVGRFFGGEPPGAPGRAWQRLDTNTSVVVIGSSHVAYGVDPARAAPGIETLCGGALDATCAGLVAARAVERAPNVKAVVLETGYLTLLGDSLTRYDSDLRPLYSLGVQLADVPHGPYWKLRQRIIESPLFYPAFFLPRMTPRDLVRRSDAQGGAAGRLASDIGAGYILTTSVVNRATDGRVVVGYHRHELFEPRVAANTDALARSIRSLQERGIRVILLRFPLHATYRAERPEAWETCHREAVDALTQQLPAGSFEYWDWMDDPAFGDGQFADGHHLNAAGAGLLSRKLAEALAGRGLLRVAAP